jgi:organic hydroperoxide reductase OsmC/OhrA
MSGREHRYAVTLKWTGNRGQGTASYRAYGRDHRLVVPGKPPLEGSSDPAFRGDPTRWNPEELLVASLAACHQLWYLHLCAAAGITVTTYTDEALGVMEETADGAGQFRRVLLQPRITLAPGADPAQAAALHDAAHAMCFIARSVNFPVAHEPEILVEAASEHPR